ncbi:MULTISPECIES: energy coupling factor transporter S component ThiW [unclassified Clostridium]|uniref:energy coupling factor transporter S component ThiW n=1 Tax=unclassified Clostridium TaxID=2614128 RepID=UPI001C8BF24B|nr:MULTISPECIES: energy coupling factor transporter S component ThiW [unclassified Clostridium]MBX9136918.1 energy coupling factor transporter S component ThiW [Clostridium sp. K12(2020)]MBX9143764.1 energy coupling factor transporter S component ThiW [Clostridium sp. K13]MDU2289397.1 energy coupling factor transporter S component ThiW [Clostridium celatum]
MQITKARENTTKKIVLSGILIAIATVLGTFSIPILGAKASPIQHFVNVIAGVSLGPIYGVACAFISALIRNILATGSILAFPGSMVGVFFAGILYKKFKKIEFAVIGEVIGTGIIGAMLAYPLAAFVLGKEVALFVYIVPFSISAILGSIMAYILLKIKVIREFLVK